jgi:predicted nucleic acid-binding protein
VIFLDTNVISETLNIVPTPHVEAWLARHDAELALSSIVIAEIAFGIQKIRPDERAMRLDTGLRIWRQRLAGRIFPFTEEAALTYGEIMGQAARQGIRMSSGDGMIAAVALANGGRLATRNVRDFRTTGLTIINPWDA